MNPMPYVDVLRAELRMERERLNLTQQELADLLGVNQGTVSAWEAGRYMPSVASLIVWADAFRRDVALIPREVEP